MTVKRNDIILISVTMVAILAIAMGLSLAASSFPDGLEKVAENLGFIDKAVDVLPEGFFLIPDYAFRGIGNESLQTSMAGLFGVLIIFIFFTIIYLIYKSAVSNKEGNK